MAIMKPANISSKISLSPAGCRATPAGSFCSDGSALICLSTSPIGRPLRSTVMVTLRRRSKRSICDGPLSVPICATAASGTLPPWALGTRSWPSRVGSDSEASASCTRIGTWRSGRLSLDRYCS